MNEDGLLDVCDILGLRSGPAYSGTDRWGPHMSISCPLAATKHGDPNDWNTSCSVSISDSDPSMAKCFSLNCQYTGSLYAMLKQSIEARGNPERLVALLKKIEPTEKFTLESSLARSRKKFEEHVDETRRISIPTRDRDVLPEARLERYRGSYPRYAITRGMTKETCNTWELGYDTQHKRLVFPVRRHDGKLVGLTGRLLPSEQERAEAEGILLSKYHNYAGLDKGRYIFGEHLLKRLTPVIICEGQIDAIITWQALGIPTVAPLGEGFSTTHARTIASFEPPVVYLFPDNDAAGRLAAEKFEYALHGRMPLKLMMPPPGLDPGELSDAQMWDALNAATPILGRIRWK